MLSNTLVKTAARSSMPGKNFSLHEYRMPDRMIGIAPKTGNTRLSPMKHIVSLVCLRSSTEHQGEHGVNAGSAGIK